MDNGCNRFDERKGVQHSTYAQAVDALVRSALANGLIEEGDELWARNTLFALVGDAGSPFVDVACEDTSGTGEDLVPSDALDVLACALKARVPHDEETLPGDVDDGFRAQVISALMPRPSEVARRFFSLLEESPEAATDYFYRLGGSADYIKHAALARNEKWIAPTEWGNLQITINLSKPEKDPRAIAKAATSTQASYPACALCWENEGYAGRDALSSKGAHAARQNLRIVPLELGGERWGLQYSPYAYYNEHCIVLSREHRPMHVDRANLERLCDFVDLLPHYFVGSNADLPIVGGSILSHDHFQGGRHTFPLNEASVVLCLQDARWPDVEIGLVKWPTAVLRVSGASRAHVVDAVCALMDAWRDYDDETVGIVSHDADGTRHNTVTPIVRKMDGSYCIDVALRCNVTSQDHPLGVFHPHEQLHHIKRENIGLIEVMGLAILPPRLKGELAAVADIMEQAIDGGLSADDAEVALRANSKSASHATWARDVFEAHEGLAREEVDAMLRQEVGEVFARVLEDTGVFKWDDGGRAAFARFADRAGLTLR